MTIKQTTCGYEALPAASRVRSGRRPVIAALGAGRMGRGIAHAFAWAGHDVLLIDLKPRGKAAAAKLKKEVNAELRATLATHAELGGFDASVVVPMLARVHFVSREGSAAALARAGVVFEGVPEVMEAKREALAFAGAHMRPSALLASTTSTFLVTSLAEFVPRPNSFLNTHWLNPAYIVPLVELSAHQRTGAKALARMKALLEGIGKVPVVCAAAPGFIVPRLQTLIMHEAARMIEEGVASAGDIDRAIRYGFGFRYATMGVVEFMDYGGNDIVWYAGNYLAGQLGERYRPPRILKTLMDDGRRGLREGRGFYDWTGIDQAAYRKETLTRLIAMLRHLGLLRPPAGGR